MFPFYFFGLFYFIFTLPFHHPFCLREKHYFIANTRIFFRTCYFKLFISHINCYYLLLINILLKKMYILPSSGISRKALDKIRILKEFWKVPSYRWVNIPESFSGNCCLQIQDSIITKFFLDSLELHDTSNKILRNVDNYLAVYMT